MENESKKEIVSNSLDLAFEFKEPTKIIINNCDKINEDEKKVANFALEHEKLTKDVANFALEEGEDLMKSINDYSKKENNLVNIAKFASENERAIKKSVDIALDNKESIKDAVDSCDKNVKTVTNIALEHENLTKDVVNFGLNQGENLATIVDNFSKKENKNILDYAKLGLDLNEPVIESLDVIFNNKEDVKQVIDENVEDGILKNVMNFAVKHEELSRGAVEVAYHIGYGIKNGSCFIF